MAAKLAVLFFVGFFVSYFLKNSQSNISAIHIALSIVSIMIVFALLFILLIKFLNALYTSILFQFSQSKVEKKTVSVSEKSLFPFQSRKHTQNNYDDLRHTSRINDALLYEPVKFDNKSIDKPSSSSPYDSLSNLLKMSSQKSNTTDKDGLHDSSAMSSSANILRAKIKGDDKFSSTLPLRKVSTVTARPVLDQEASCKKLGLCNISFLTERLSDWFKKKLITPLLADIDEVDLFFKNNLMEHFLCKIPASASPLIFVSSGVSDVRSRSLNELSQKAFSNPTVIKRLKIEKLFENIDEESTRSRLINNLRLFKNGSFGSYSNGFNEISHHLLHVFCSFMDDVIVCSLSDSVDIKLFTRTYLVQYPNNPSTTIDALQLHVYSTSPFKVQVIMRDVILRPLEVIFNVYFQDSNQFFSALLFFLYASKTLQKGYLGYDSLFTFRLTNIERSDIGLPDFFKQI